MEKKLQFIEVKIFYGPNIFVPFQSIQAELYNSFGYNLSINILKKQWEIISKYPLYLNKEVKTEFSFHEIVASIAVNLQHPSDEKNACFKIIDSAINQQKSIFLKFIDPNATSLALRTAILFAHEIFKAAVEKRDVDQNLIIQLKNVRLRLDGLLPQRPIIRALVNEANRRTIPVFTVAEKSRIFLFGQGCKGTHFIEAATDKDSSTGMSLQRDKILSNILVKRLGFPGVTHSVAQNLEQALKIATHLDYPVVVKPISSGKGNGVSAFVTNNADLNTAYKTAAAFSSQGVIIEKHVKGTDHRLAIFGGKVGWVAARYPASITGDGVKTIEELIKIENARRAQSKEASDGGLIQIIPDSDMLEHLEKFGYSLKNIVPHGLRVNLRSVSNISKGGSIADVTELVHPDNIAMAEAIARGFRIDALGVDFMTPNISQSWRDVDCAVIEVNGTPGIFFDSRVKKIIDASFPNNSVGQIPSVLIIEPPSGVTEEINEIITSNGLIVGRTNGTSTFLEKHARCSHDESLFNRILSLFADPNCEAIIIETDVNSILQQGLPLAEFTVVLCFVDIPVEVDALLRNNSKIVLFNCNKDQNYKDEIRYKIVIEN